jgi:hypothetical protein
MTVVPTNCSNLYSIASPSRSIGWQSLQKFVGRADWNGLLNVSKVDEHSRTAAPGHVDNVKTTVLCITRLTVANLAC